MISFPYQMVEKILDHHINIIINEIIPEGPTDHDVTVIKVRTYVDFLTKLPYRETKGYSFLLDRMARRRFEEALIRATELTINGSVEIIPDAGLDGTYNHDFICLSCGNFSGSNCTFGENHH